MANTQSLFRSGGTDVEYNGVFLRNVLTREWRQEVVYDKSSNTDALFSKFYLEFDGLICLQGPTPTVVTIPTGAAVQAQNAAQLYRQIQACLWEPRQLLTVTFAGQSVLRALHVDAGTDPDCDVDNGPKPKIVQLTHVAANNVFRLRFGIEVAKVECCSDVGSDPIQQGKAPQFVLSNRWSIGESMDANFYTTRTVRGEIRCSQAMANNVFSLKPAIMPTLEAGFKRDSIEFEVLPNGLEATYAVVDRQVHTAAPYPATKISGHFVEATHSQTMRYSEGSVRLEAPPNTDKGLLMLRCVQVITARMGTDGQLNSTKNGYLEEASFFEEIGETCVVELRVRMNRTTAGNQNNGSYLGNLPLSTFGQPLELPGDPTNYDPSQSPVPWPYGYTSGQSSPRDPSDPTNAAAVLYAMKCFLQTPCDANHAMGQITELTAGTLVPQSSATQETKVSATTVTELQSFQGSSMVNSDATTSVYRFAHMTSCYKVKRLKVGLPVAGDITNPSAEATKFITLGLPQCTREITIDAERVGQWPVLPPPDETYTDGAIVGTLLDHHVEPHAPTLNADGTQQIFRITGRYVYGLNRAPLANESLLVGVLPFSTASQDSVRFDPSTGYSSAYGPGAGASGVDTELVSE